MKTVNAMAALLIRELGSRRFWLPALLLGLVAFFSPRLAVRAGTGSAREQYHLHVVYGIGLPAFLITLLGITLAAGLARDIESRRIQSLVTKPIHARQIVVGHFLGLMCVGGVALVCVQILFGLPRSSLQDSQSGAAGPAQMPIESFLVPRSEVGPELQALDPAAVSARIEALRQEGRGGREASRAELEARALRALRSLQIRPGESAELTFRMPGDVSAGTEPHGLPVRFVVYAYRPWESGRMSLEWEVGEGSSAVRARSSSVLPGVPAEVVLPIASAAAGGMLRLRVRNAEAADSGATVVLDLSRVHVLPEAHEVFSLQHSALWLLWWRLGLILSVALAASCVFRVSTAVLLSLFVYMSALASSFLKETFQLFEGESGLGGLSDPVAGLASRLGGLALEVLPDFSRLDPLDRLTSVQAIQPRELALETAWIAGECVLLLAFGSFLLRRRELGRP